MGLKKGNMEDSSRMFLSVFKYVKSQETWPQLEKLRTQKSKAYMLKNTKQYCQTYFIYLHLSL